MPECDLVYEILDSRESHEWFLISRDMTQQEREESYGLSSLGRYKKPSPFFRYIKMRLDRQSHSIAMMLATRSFPGVKTDSVFNEGKFSGTDGRLDKEQLWLREQSEARGISTNGKWYCHGLASYAGDPTAWVDGRGDVERIAREKNMTVHGYVEHKGREVEPMADIPIDPRLVRAETLDILDSNPGAKYEDVYERVHDVRTGKVDLNPLVGVD